MLTWEDVNETHRAWTGIYASGGQVISLLCNQSKNGSYSDQVFEDRIHYLVTRKTLPAGARALTNMVGSSTPVRVFEKLGVNQWKDLGLWLVDDVREEHSSLAFILRPGT
jgi:hypothetical protein